MKRSLVALLAITSIVLVLYPIIVHWGLSRGYLQAVALFVAAIAILRFLIVKGIALKKPPSLSSAFSVATPLTLGAVCLAGASFFFKNEDYLRLYPVVVNVTFLFVFALTLFQPPSMIERFARLREPVLSLSAKRYTRKVTYVWCLFFIFNGLISLWTSLLHDTSLWVFYNGFISYILIGLLFAAEWLVRQQVHKRDKKYPPLCAKEKR